MMVRREEKGRSGNCFAVLSTSKHGMAPVRHGKLNLVKEREREIGNLSDASALTDIEREREREGTRR